MPTVTPLHALLAALLLCTLAPLAAAEEGQGPALLAPLSDDAVLELPSGERLDPAVPGPAEFLGYPLGARFTHHERILAYLEALAAASERVALWSYGSSYEGRPLTLLAVSSAANIARLEEIRRRHLELADPSELSDRERKRLLDEVPVAVWLGYGVHGNESSSSEAAMAAAWLLAADRGAGAEGGDVADPLAGTVVLLDPLSNPDGRERYVHAYEQRRGSGPDPDPQAFEHQEPWPGGRQNHYLFDLNRDWSWATQQETRHRLTAYRRWEPQVHVDLHEMSSRSTYFFPPAAEPVHPQIDRGVLAWLDVFGRANAAAFDRHGWLYFKEESFDLYYPGYGDSYPFLRGAVGMTYEMAGGGRAGQAVRLPDGGTLTLADRIARHLTTSLTTVETAAARRRELLAGFVEARLAAGAAEATSFVWAAGQPEARALAELLDLHGIQVHRLSRDAELTVEAATAPEEPPAGLRRRFTEGDFAVSTRQPLGALVRILMGGRSPMPQDFVERQRRRVDDGLRAEFYDITGWALPLAFNLEVWRLAGEPPALRAFLATPAPGRVEGEGRVGYLIPPQGLAGYRAAAELRRLGVAHRLALEAVEIGGEGFPAGTLFVPRAGNSEELEETIAAVAADTGVRVSRVATSYHSGGVSLGSGSVVPVRPSRVGLVTGEGTSPTSVGALWFLLDREIELPHSRLDLDRLEETDLSEFDVLVLPDGSGYHRRLGEEGGEVLERWIEAGGTLVAMGGAVEWLQERRLTSVESREAEEGENGEAPLSTPGAVVATELPVDHPLAAGLRSPPAVLVRGDRVLEPTGKPRRDLLKTVEGSPVVDGFAWPEAEERLAGSLLVAVESRGDGLVVVFAQEPTYRHFWRATMPLLLNAVMYGPSLEDAERY